VAVGRTRRRIRAAGVWASLTQAQAKRGLAAIEADCLTTDIDGMALYASEPSWVAASDGPGPVVDLVQGNDEIVMSYSESRLLLAGGLGSLPVPDRSSYLHTILCDGRLAGHRRHRFGRAGAVIDLQLRRPLASDERTALEGAGARYGCYLGVQTTLAEPVLMARMCGNASWVSRASANMLDRLDLPGHAERARRATDDLDPGNRACRSDSGADSGQSR
jgi:hypothetical protein